MALAMARGKARVAWCGGHADGKLGTVIADIRQRIDDVWSPRGVVVLVDLGGAELNSETAIEMLDVDRRERVRLCTAPIVEGAIMAVAEASVGGDLASVQRAAEDAV